MYYSITFKKVLADGETTETRNTWDDWKLIPTSRPMISAPGITTKYVSVPGKEVPYDLTTYLTGKVVKSPRSGNIEFLATNDYKDYNWVNLREELLSWLHGEEADMYLEEDETAGKRYYYHGRFSVEPKSGSDWSTITINYQVEPERYFENKT